MARKTVIEHHCDEIRKYENDRVYAEIAFHDTGWVLDLGGQEAPLSDYKEFKIQITYCPFCGRDLRKKLNGVA